MWTDTEFWGSCDKVDRHRKFWGSCDNVDRHREFWGFCDCGQTQRHRHMDCNVIKSCLTWNVSDECSEHQRAGQLDNTASLAQGRANYVQSQA